MKDDVVKFVLFNIWNFEFEGAYVWMLRSPNTEGFDIPEDQWIPVPEGTDLNKVLRALAGWLPADDLYSTEERPRYAVTIEEFDAFSQSMSQLVTARGEDDEG